MEQAQDISGLYFKMNSRQIDLIHLNLYYVLVNA